MPNTNSPGRHRTVVVSRRPITFPSASSQAAPHSTLLTFSESLRGCSFAHQFQDPHPGVVVVHDVALRRLPDQFLKNRLHILGGRRDDIPLGRGGQWDLQALLQDVLAVEGDAGAILQQTNHARRCRVIFLRFCRCGDARREDLAARIAPQLLELVNGGADRRPANQADQHARVAHGVDRPLPAFRTRIARLERGVANPDPSRAAVVVGPVTPVARLLRRHLLGRRLGPSGADCWWHRARRGLVLGGRSLLLATDDLAGLLRTRAEQQLSQAADGGVLVVDQLQQ